MAGISKEYLAQLYEWACQGNSNALNMLRELGPAALAVLVSAPAAAALSPEEAPITSGCPKPKPVALVPPLVAVSLSKNKGKAWTDVETPTEELEDLPKKRKAVPGGCKMVKRVQSETLVVDVLLEATSLEYTHPALAVSNYYRFLVLFCH
jgi:hypothetical protein